MDKQKKQKLERSVLSTLIVKPDFYQSYPVRLEWFSNEPILADEVVGRLKGSRPLNANIVTPYPEHIDSTNYKDNVQELCEIFRNERVVEILSQGLLKKDDPNVSEWVKKELNNLDDSREGYKHIEEIMPETLKQIEKSMESKGLSGVDTGFERLNKKTGGWQPGDLIILAGRPGMGKTSLSIQFALNSNVPVLYFSIEMVRRQIGMRILSHWSDVGTLRMRTGNLNPDEFNKLIDSSLRSTDQELYIYDGTPNIEEIRAMCYKAKREHGVGLIFIDYLQKIPLMPGKKDGNYGVGYNSSECKAIAKELDTPIILLSQLNRSVESRGGLKKPQMSDLRDSGQIEQDADIVAFCYRPEYYGFEGPSELMIKKHRNGPLGDVNFKWNGELTKFEEVEPEFYENETPF